jgi:hypothetical protein
MYLEQKKDIELDNKMIVANNEIEYQNYDNFDSDDNSRAREQ